MKIKSYQKIPHQIEAVQWDGSNTSAHAIRDWTNGQVGCTYDADGDVPFLKVNTLEGNVVVRPTDFIIKGIQGEFYPCREDIFLDSYRDVPVHTPVSQDQLIEESGRELTLFVPGRDILIQSNHMGPIQIIGVASAYEEQTKQHLYLALYKVVNKTGKLKISDKQFILLKSIFNYIQQEEQPTIDNALLNNKHY